MARLVVLVLSLMLGGGALGVLAQPTSSDAAPTPVPAVASVRLADLRNRIIVISETQPGLCRLSVTTGNAATLGGYLKIENRTVHPVLVEIDHENVVAIRTTITSGGALEVRPDGGDDELFSVWCDRADA